MCCLPSQPPQRRRKPLTVVGKLIAGQVGRGAVDVGGMRAWRHVRRSRQQRAEPFRVVTVIRLEKTDETPGPLVHAVLDAPAALP